MIKPGRLKENIIIINKFLKNSHRGSPDSNYSRFNEIVVIKNYFENSLGILKNYLDHKPSNSIAQLILKLEEDHLIVFTDVLKKHIEELLGDRYQENIFKLRGYLIKYHKDKDINSLFIRFNQIYLYIKEELTFKLSSHVELVKEVLKERGK